MPEEFSAEHSRDPIDKQRELASGGGRRHWCLSSRQVAIETRQGHPDRWIIMTVARIKQETLALKPAQRLRLVQDIWDSLAEEQASVPVPAWHRKILDERNRDFERNPQNTISLAELKQRLAKRRRARRKA